MSFEEINALIAKKVEELSGLVSEEGAAHIVANELGVSIFGENNVKINEIIGNMRELTVYGKVAAIYDTIQFQKNSNPGKVKNLILADETGRIRASFWHDAAVFLDENQVKAGAILKLEGVMSRENNRVAELSVSKKENITINPKGVSIAVNDDTQTKKIVEITTGNNSILGVVVQIFKPNFYYKCPKCGKRILNETCLEHGKVEAKMACVFNVIIDDGSASIRAVFFNETAEKFTNKSTEDLQNVTHFEEVKASIMGHVIKITGNVRFSSFLGENEIIVNSLNEIDITKEKKILEKKLYDGA